MTAEEARASWYVRREIAEPAGGDSSVARGQDFGIVVEDKEDWDLSEIPMESSTGVHTTS